MKIEMFVTADTRKEMLVYSTIQLRFTQKVQCLLNYRTMELLIYFCSSNCSFLRSCQYTIVYAPGSGVANKMKVTILFTIYYMTLFL